MPSSYFQHSSAERKRRDARCASPRRRSCGRSRGNNAAAARSGWTKAAAEWNNAMIRLFAPFGWLYGNGLSGGSLRRGLWRLQGREVVGKLFVFEHRLRFLNQVPAATNAELGEQRRNMELNGANRNAQVIGDFLVDSVMQYFLENFSFARTEVNQARKFSPGMKKLVGVFFDSLDQRVFSGNPNSVIGGRISASHTA